MSILSQGVPDRDHLHLIGNRFRNVSVTRESASDAQAESVESSLSWDVAVHEVDQSDQSFKELHPVDTELHFVLCRHSTPIEHVTTYMEFIFQRDDLKLIKINN